ncbi:MAG: replicative DNA helicase [Clostridia bacterium]|nr:replicative DNA helicase [Clostridia bacterium]
MASQKNEKKKINKNLLVDMPHSVEAEQALLGCIILDNRIQVEVAANLNADDFYVEAHKIIFSAMNDLIIKNQPVDMVILADSLDAEGNLEQIGGVEYLAQLADFMPSTANYKSYFDIVKNDSMRRKLIFGASDIIKSSIDIKESLDSLAFAEKTVYDISNMADTSEMTKVSAVLPEVMATLDELSKNTSSVKGIKTGFTGIDSLLNGLHKSDLIILAARPAVGKTSFAMNVVSNVALQGSSCAVFSLEMSKAQLVQRMVCSVAGVNMANAKKGLMSKNEWVKIARARELLSNSKIYIDDSALITPQQILSKCRRLKSKVGLDLVMIDYVQLMNSENSKKDANRQQEISEISRYLKIMAKELNVPVIALSQLSRSVEQRKGRPQLSDLRESGAIEQDADIVMFIHRPDKGATEKELAEGKVQPNVAEILIEKHRNGSTGVVKLYFKGETTTFVNLNKDGEIIGEKDDDAETPNAPVEKDLSPITVDDAPFDVEEEPAKEDGGDALFD